MSAGSRANSAYTYELFASSSSICSFSLSYVISDISTSLIVLFDNAELAFKFLAVFGWLRCITIELFLAINCMLLNCEKLLAGLLTPIAELFIADNVYDISGS